MQSDHFGADLFGESVPPPKLVKQPAKTPPPPPPPPARANDADVPVRKFTVIKETATWTTILNDE
jgi:hypothetical protein